MECRSLEWIPPKKDGILSLQNFSSELPRRTKVNLFKIFFSKNGIENLRPEEGYFADFSCQLSSLPFCTIKSKVAVTFLPVFIIRDSQDIENRHIMLKTMALLVIDREMAVEAICLVFLPELFIAICFVLFVFS